MNRSPTPRSRTSLESLTARTPSGITLSETKREIRCASLAVADSGRRLVRRDEEVRRQPLIDRLRATPSEMSAARNFVATPARSESGQPWRAPAGAGVPVPPGDSAQAEVRLAREGKGCRAPEDPLEARRSSSTRRRRGSGAGGGSLRREGSASTKRAAKTHFFSPWRTTTVVSMGAYPKASQRKRWGPGSSGFASPSSPSARG